MENQARGRPKLSGEVRKLNRPRASFDRLSSSRNERSREKSTKQNNVNEITLKDVRACTME